LYSRVYSRLDGRNDLGHLVIEHLGPGLNGGDELVKLVFLGGRGGCALGLNVPDLLLHPLKFGLALGSERHDRSVVGVGFENLLHVYKTDFLSSRLGVRNERAETQGRHDGEGRNCFEIHIQERSTAYFELNEPKRQGGVRPLNCHHDHNLFGGKPGGKQVRVSEWMTPNPVTVTPETPVLDALKLLKEHGFRRLPVVEGGRLIGITTRKDLRDAMPSKATTLSVWELNYLLSKLTVAEMMSRPVVTASEHEDMEDAALRMQEHRVGGLPVLGDDGRLSGMVTVSDVLRAFTEILGLREGGVRLTLEMPDVPGSLARAVQALAPSNIISVATAGGENGRRRFVIRVVGEGQHEAARRVREAGLDVLDE
jgi:acetoin utilization protein AcuB